MIIREIKDINYIKKNNKKYPVYTHVYKKNNKIIDPNNINFPFKRIPPAYPYVEIYPNKDPLAKCRDNENRLQYIYSKEFQINQNNKKYCSLLKPINNLENLLNFISKNSKQNTINKEKAISTLLLLMSQCHFRIGNNKFEKRYGSFGLTTLHKSHFKGDNRGLIVEFVGKKGVINKCAIEKNSNLFKSLIPFLKNSKEYLFEYEDGKKLNSKDVNDFLKEKMNIRAKDLRTYFANLLFIEELKKYYPKNKKEISDIIEIVSNKLHHSKSICKSSYLYPPIISDAENGGKFFNKNKSSIEIFKQYLKKNC